MHCGDLHVSDWVAEVRSVSGVKAALEDIRVRLGDDAGAHKRSDELCLGILKAIASGRAKNIKEMAELAIDVETMAFERWYE